jgi:glycosyltransferase involved in cell wall biosynthesis
MRVLLWGTYDTGKPRARILGAGLRAVGVDLEEIHTNVWDKIEDKSQVKGAWSRLCLLARWLAAYPGLTWRLIRAPKPDLLLIGYPGLLDAFIATFIGRIRNIPVAWDVFISIYDTVVEDRRLLRADSLAARFLRAVEKRALRRTNLVFMDTAAHARRIETLFELPAQSCGAVWVGVEKEHFAPIAPIAPQSSAIPLQVLFYGQFIPLHGIPTIIEAARILKNAPVEWTLIGRGQEAEKIRAMLDAEPLSKVRWLEWVDYGRLREQIAQADLCLGIFGRSEKAASVIPNKVFQIVAARRPLVTRDSPAIRELLRPCPGCVYLVPDGDPHALAQAIGAHIGNGRHAGACHDEVSDLIDKQAIGTQFLKLVQQAGFECNR